MNLGVVIEVAIGLIFVWLILSLSTIQIQEWIASLFEFREKDLERAIGKMLANPRLTEEFYKHPLIQAFFKKTGKKPAYIPPREFALTLFNIVTTAGTENSAIQQMLATLPKKKIGELLPGFSNGKNRSQLEKALDNLIEKAGNLAVTASESVVTQFQNLPEYRILTSPQTEELKEWVEKNHPEFSALAGAVPAAVTDWVNNIPAAVLEYKAACKNIDLAGGLGNISPDTLEKGIDAIGKINPDLERSLRSMLTGAKSYVTGAVSAAENGLLVARTNVESWFNSSMESLSGWYKRRSQIITFFLGFGLAAALSVDSIALVQRLWMDPTLRAIMVENASAFDMPTETPVPIVTPEAAGEPPAGDSAPSETPAAIPVAPADTVRNFQAQFEGLELPLGWVSVQSKAAGVPEIACALYPEWKLWLKVFKVDTGKTVVQGFSPTKDVCYRPSGTTVPLKSVKPTYEEKLKTHWLFTWFVGILLSAAATTQGAPFWFDILNKLINLRGAGTRPPTTQESATQK